MRGHEALCAWKEVHSGIRVDPEIMEQRLGKVGEESEGLASTTQNQSVASYVDVVPCYPARWLSQTSTSASPFGQGTLMPGSGWLG